MSTPALKSRAFLFTDVEGSTKLWENHEDLMYDVIARHDALAVETLAATGGTLVKPRGEGDSLFIVYETAREAVAGAFALQRNFLAESWPVETPLRVRMAVHTGEAEFREGDYYGTVVNRAARLRAIGHGGQILLSQSTETLAGAGLPENCCLRDMQAHRLKDLQREERVFQLLHPELPAEFPPLLSLNRNRHNLPIQWKRFIGREEEIKEISAALETTPLVTLTGAGGMGKTRLALQVAAEQIEKFADGVWFIRLDRLTESEGGLISQAIAAETGLKMEAGGSQLTALCDAIKTKNLLLIFDNCEHILTECKEVVTALLQCSPELKIMATSHAPLGVSGEKQFLIPTLGFPKTQDLTPQRLAAPPPDYAAARLFVECARRVKPNFAVTERSAKGIAQICEELDGVPLLIELAAARVKSLSLESMVRQLQNILTDGDAQGTGGRHESSESVVGWSYALLAEARQRLLRRLSIFVGGFTLEAAQAVCADANETPEAVLSHLLTLIDRSLVLPEEDEAGEFRYRLLNVIGAYARKRLRDSGEQETVAERSRDYFLQLAEEAEPYLVGPDQAEWFTRLEREHDNLRAALRWSTDGAAQLRMAGALQCFWRTRGYYQEGRRWLAEALAQTPNAGNAIRVKALNGAGILAYLQHDYAEAQERFSQALAIARSERSERDIARLVNNLGLVLLGRSDPQGARPLFEESLQRYTALRDEARMADVLNSIGMIAHGENNFLEARNYFGNCAAIHRRIDNKWALAIALHNLGDVAYKLGEYRDAERLHQQSLELRYELKDYANAVHSLFNLAVVTAASGQSRRAAVLFSSAKTLDAKINVTLLPADRNEYDTEQVNLRRMLSAEDCADAQRQGETFSLEQIVEFALRQTD